jgi:nucleotide-binding universal stress UspA family protein
LINAGKILVPVDGSPLDEEMIDLACEMAKRSRSKLFAVHVIEVKRTLPLEIDLPAEIERGEDILQKVEEMARKRKQDIETELLQARDAGTAIVEEADRRAIDVVLMGLKFRKRFDQFYMGSSVTHVLKNVSCRVCVCREPIP